jgi:hypothetical protein
MTIIIWILAIYGLAFFIKQSSGPFDVMDKLRSKLMLNKQVGVFFFKLLDCWFCLGCHCGWIVYLLSDQPFKLQFFILWSLAGGTISLLIDALLSKLHQ